MRLESTAVVEGSDRALVLELSRANSRPMLLEASAFAIWREIDGASDTDEIVQRLMDGRDFDAERVRGDVERFLRRLEKDHVIASAVAAATSSAERRTA